jgi:hypothetical protein
VLDLLSDEDAEALIGEAHRLLSPGGLLALVSMTYGTTATSRLVAGGRDAIARRWPGLVVGCRPIELRDLLKPGSWADRERDVVRSWGIPSEVLIATRQDGS